MRRFALFVPLALIQFKTSKSNIVKRILLFVPLALAACAAEHVAPNLANVAAKAETLNEDSVMVVDGVLTLPATVSYVDLGGRLVNQPTEERLQWEERIGFYSLLSYADDVVENSGLRLGEALARPEVFCVSADSVVDLDVPLSLAALANKDGYFRVGEAVCKVDNHRMAFVRGGSLSLADEALWSGALPDGADGFVYAHSPKSTLKAAEATRRYKELTGHVRSSSLWTDYKIKVIPYKETTYNYTARGVQVEQSSKNFKKKVRRWRQHRDTNAYMYVKVRLLHPSLWEDMRLEPRTVQLENYYGNKAVNHRRVTTLHGVYGDHPELDNIQPYILGFDDGYLSGANGMRMELKSLIPE